MAKQLRPRNEARALEILKEVFPSAVIKVHPQINRKGPADFVVKIGNQPLVVEVKESKSPRISDVEGKLAVGLVQISSWIDNHPERSVVMIGLPKLGPRILAHTRKFMNTYAQQAGWCLFDLRGAYHFEMQSKGIQLSAEPTQRPKPAPLTPKGSIFSDLNRWMLKILLMSDVAPTLWGGPKVTINRPSDLCNVAKVSTEKAYSFLRSLTAAGFVQHDQDGIRVIRRAELLQTWMSHQLTFQHESRPARWIFGPINELKEVIVPLEGPSEYAVTGFEACRLLRVLHAPLNRREVYVRGEIGYVMKAWNLTPCDVRDADIFLVKMSCPESVLRGVVKKRDLPVVDILEAALSVFPQLPRGPQQANHIIEQVLGWEGRIDE